TRCSTHMAVRTQYCPNVEARFYHTILARNMSWHRPSTRRLALCTPCFDHVRAAHRISLLASAKRTRPSGQDGGASTTATGTDAWPGNKEGRGPDRRAYGPAP